MTIDITAVNCGNQEGITTAVIISTGMKMYDFIIMPVTMYHTHKLRPVNDYRTIVVHECAHHHDE